MRALQMLLNYFMRLLGSGDRTAAPASLTTPTAEAGIAFEKWLEHFYKECGREVTLAYTTLNQMKNWAVFIVGAALSAVVTISKTGANTEQRDLAVFVGAAVAYVFALRFFMRAIICYDNLVRWNNLQRAVVSYKLLAPENEPVMTAENLKRLIQQLYFDWRVPSRMTRWRQIRDNLKLGFGLLLLFPVLFAATFAAHVAKTYLGAAVAAFCIGYTLVELSDFLGSPLFDTPEANARRRDPRRMFPTPNYGAHYLIGLTLTFAISLGIAFWPELRASLIAFLCR